MNQQDFVDGLTARHLEYARLHAKPGTSTSHRAPPMRAHEEITAAVSPRDRRGDRAQVRLSALRV
jgi:hypothetical protein